MIFRKAIAFALACFLLATGFSGCGCQKVKTTETTAETTETTADIVSKETTTFQDEIVETTEKASAETTQATIKEDVTENTGASQMTEPVEEDIWGEDPTVDTRPPIEVTIPKETQPYTDYEQYMNMSGEDQEAFFRSFENEQDFFDWFNAAKDEYEQAHPPVIIDGSTNIEIKP